jgi:hypothetical protein
MPIWAGIESRAPIFFKLKCLGFFSDLSLIYSIGDLSAERFYFSLIAFLIPD